MRTWLEVPETEQYFFWYYITVALGFFIVSPFV